MPSPKTHRALMRNEPHYQPDEPASTEAFSPRADDALTDLHSYALLLDAECHRMGDRLTELVETEASPADLSRLVRQRADLAEELEALRGATADLRRELELKRAMAPSAHA